jgi:hypothetical protein
LRLFEVEGGGEKLRAFEKAEAAFHPLLALIVVQESEGWQALFIEIVGGQDKTTLLRY